jgi:hypothetical protein
LLRDVADGVDTGQVSTFQSTPTER